ncbi:Hypothetical protein PHPALM_6049 [Phytophthora palmivora]|uniref:RxLR effector protein n=1 Tax=Phytophthora palmivora TaxID=4796 RepID=A0A2P4YFV4_9STRA|nr:Hypothetical protein PHPALM_6049 [Phytophthora palmivora]
MRSLYVAIVVIALLLACSRAIDDRSLIQTRSKPQPIDYKRSMNVTGKAQDDAQSEERIVGITPKWLTQFRIWKLKREATWQMNKTPEQLQKEMKEANKKLLKEAEEYHSWMAARLTPDEIYIKLGLLKLGDDATTSPNFRRYQAYMEVYTNMAHDVKAKDFTPDYIYEKLGLLKLGDRAMESINFRHYEMYLILWKNNANGVVHAAT